MLETEFVRSLQSNYERIRLSDKPDEQRYQYCILTRGGIRGLLPCSLRYINGDAYLYYDITSRQNVAQLYSKQTIDRMWFKDFMWSYEQACQELGRFLLDEQNILVYPEQIFEDLGSRSFLFLYLPYNEDGNGFQKFLEFVLEHMDYDDSALVECVYYIYEQFEKYGDVYLQSQVFDDARKLENSNNIVEEIPDGTLDQSTIWEEKVEESDLFQKIEDIEDEVKEKKGFLSVFGIKKKKRVEQQGPYKENMLTAMEGCVVAEESEYQEEDCGKTIYIEQKADERGVHKLYTPDGRVMARLEKEVLVVGKKREEVDLVLEDESVSRLHARICKDENLVYLEDLNSTNGTFKNGLRLQPYEKRRLEEGDEIQFGKLLFVYR